TIAPVPDLIRAAHPSPGALLVAGRRMGPTERLLHDMHTYGTFVVGHTARISGPLSETLVRQALDAVQRRHPLLRVHVARGGGDFISDGATPIPLRVVTRDAEARWQRVFEDELNAPIPYGAHPLIRVVLLTDGSSQDHELVLISSHAII